MALEQNCNKCVILQDKKFDFIKDGYFHELDKIKVQMFRLVEFMDSLESKMLSRSLECFDKDTITLPLHTYYSQTRYSY